MNYYELLEIDENASEEVVKAAYRALAKKYHPDICGEDKEKRMTELNTAFEILSNPEKRRDYDKSLSIKKTKVEDTTGHVWKEENSKEYQNIGTIGKFAKAFAQNILDGIKRDIDIMDQSYIDGISMSDYCLVRAYKTARGFQRVGYAKALELRGMIYKDKKGNYVYTNRFKNLL